MMRCQWEYSVLPISPSRCQYCSWEVLPSLTDMLSNQCSRFPVQAPKKSPTTNQEVFSLFCSIPIEIKKNKTKAKIKVKRTLGEVIKASQADWPTFLRQKDFLWCWFIRGGGCTKERREWRMEWCCGEGRMDKKTKPISPKSHLLSSWLWEDGRRKGGGSICPVAQRVCVCVHVFVLVI